MDMNMRTFEELQRHQLVTEFDIQSQSELDDYQVKLDNISNPTQAQDNLVVGADGTPLNHWNESVDFDTWVKMPIETSGKRGLLIHGNDGLSSVSSGDDTFMFFDDFESTMNWTTKWASPLQSSYITTSGELRMTEIDATANRLITQSSYNNFIVETAIKSTNTNSAAYMYAHSSTTWNSNDGMNYDFQGSTATTAIGGVQTVESVTEDLSDYFQCKLEIPSSGNGVATMLYPNGDALSTRTGTPTSRTSYVSLFEWQGSYAYIKLFKIRQYATIEPTVQISTPKNILTALKSFGRAG